MIRSSNKMPTGNTSSPFWPLTSKCDLDLWGTVLVLFLCILLLMMNLYVKYVIYCSLLISIFDIEREHGNLYKWTISLCLLTNFDIIHIDCYCTLLFQEMNNFENVLLESRKIYTLKYYVIILSWLREFILVVFV